MEDKEKCVFAEKLCNKECPFYNPELEDCEIVRFASRLFAVAEVVCQFV